MQLTVSSDSCECGEGFRHPEASLDGSIVIEGSVAVQSGLC